MANQHELGPRRISRRDFLRGLFGLGVAAAVEETVWPKFIRHGFSKLFPSAEKPRPSTSPINTGTSKPTETSPTTPPTTPDKTPETTPPTKPPEKNPIVTENGFLYNVVGKEWFGGFIINSKIGEESVGFTKPEKGPRQFYDQLLSMIIHQTGGKYGKTTEELEAYLEKNNYIIPDFRFPTRDPNMPDRYIGYPPTFVVPSDPVALDLKKPVKITDNKDLLREKKLRPITTAGGGTVNMIVVHKGQFYVIDTAEYGNISSLSGATYVMLETTAQIQKYDDLPQEYKDYSAKPGEFKRGLISYINYGLAKNDRSRLVLNPDAFRVYKDETSPDVTYSIFSSYEGPRENRTASV